MEINICFLRLSESGSESENELLPNKEKRAAKYYTSGKFVERDGRRYCNCCYVISVGKAVRKMTS